MPLYLSRFSYTPETWAKLIRNPEDRRKAAQLYIESVGGKLHGFWYAFGTHDGYNLWEAPDNVSMAAVALAIGGGGALGSFGNDGPPERRRNDGCAAKGQASPVPSARRVAARASRSLSRRQCADRSVEARSGGDCSRRMSNELPGAIAPRRKGLRPTSATLWPRTEPLIVAGR